MRNRNPWWMRLLQRIGVLSSPASDGYAEISTAMSRVFRETLHVDTEDLGDGTYQHTFTPRVSPSVVDDGPDER